MAASVASSTKRELGMVEASWCSILEGGTGIQVSGLYFTCPLSRSSVQAAVKELIDQLPYLNSQIRVGEKKKLLLELRKTVATVSEDLNPFIIEGEVGGKEDAKETWLRIVDLESNRPFPPYKNDGGSSVFQVSFYTDLPNNSSLIVLRLQACAFDTASLGSVVSTFVRILRQTVEKEEKGHIEELLQKMTIKDDSLAKFTYHPPLEDMIPKGAADKSLLSMGINMVGYGVAASKQRYIPFTDAKTKEIQSRHIRTSLSREAVERLVEACKKNSSDLYGALSSAVLKAIADYKRLGKNKEHYGAAVLFNCRHQLSPPLPQETIGFYNSAILALTPVTEGVNGGSPFWKVSKEVTKNFNETIKSQKHFKDMKDLNYLMTAAVKHPGDTPEGTLRTATLGMLHDPVPLNIPREAAEFLQLKDHVEVCSCHGVGPCMFVYPFVNDGALDLTFTYPSPLFSRAQMQTLVDTTRKYLIDSSA